MLQTKIIDANPKLNQNPDFYMPVLIIEKSTKYIQVMEQIQIVLPHGSDLEDRNLMEQ
jgi:hypothetical protein